MGNSTKINMLMYKETVRDNRKFFDSLNSEMEVQSKIINNLSRTNNHNKVLDFFGSYGDISIKNIIIEMLGRVPRSINKEVVVWFISFDLRLRKKVSRESWDYGMYSILNPREETQYQYEFGLLMDVKIRSKQYSFIENPDTISKSWKLLTEPSKILLDYKSKIDYYGEGMKYLIDIMDTMPNSIKEEYEKINKLHNERVEIGELLNFFQYKVYIKTMPKKVSQDFIKNELRRLRNGRGPRKNGIKTTMFVFRALIETYGLDNLLKTKYFLEMVNKNLIQSVGAEDFSNEDIEITLTNDLVKIIYMSTMIPMGFSMDTVKESLKKLG